MASEQLKTTRLNQYEFIGELALTGALRAVPGAIPSAIEAIKAKRQLIASADNAAELSLIGGNACFIASHLQEVCAFLNGQQPLNEPIAETTCPAEKHPDLIDVIGQQQAKRALEIVASGGHSLLLIGLLGQEKPC